MTDARPDVRGVRTFVVSSLAALTCFVAGACAAPSNARSETATTPPPSSSKPSPTKQCASDLSGAANDASSSAWAQEGEHLVTQAKNDPPVNISNGGAWAFQSRPVDIPGDGRFNILIPVPDGFSLTPPAGSLIPAAWAFLIPQDLARVAQVGFGQPEILATDGQTSVKVPVTVSGLCGGYANFSAWIYP